MFRDERKCCAFNFDGKCTLVSNDDTNQLCLGEEQCKYNMYSNC